jgi:hypothetical protein
MQPGDLYTSGRLHAAVKKLNESGRFENVDAEQDVRILMNEKTQNVDLIIAVRKPVR